MRAHTKIQLAIVGGSVVLHLAGWAAVGLFGKERKHDTVAIELSDSKKKKEEERKPPPPPPPEIAPQKAKVVAPAPKAPEPTPEPKAPAEAPKGNDMSGFADLGIGPLSNGGGGGIGVPSGPGGSGGGGAGGGAPQPAPTSKPRHVALAPQEECADEMVKPKISHVVTPVYPESARQANKEGDVRLELTIDATGHVVAVKVLSGLGFGLEEAATAAAKQWLYAPATRCGKAVPTTVIKKVPFHLT